MEKGIPQIPGWERGKLINFGVWGLGGSVGKSQIPNPSSEPQNSQEFPRISPWGGNFLGWEFLQYIPRKGFAIGLIQEFTWNSFGKSQGIYVEFFWGSRGIYLEFEL